MPHPIEPSTLRILTPDGKTVGTGFLVTKNIAVTCMHVVSSAGLDVDGRISIQFTDQKHPTTAIWLDQYFISGADVAILQVDDVPSGVSPLRLASSVSKAWNKLYSFGYATTIGQTGLGSLGTFITQKTGGNYIQFDSPHVDHGFSGAPLFDENLKVVIGMINMGNDELGRNDETTFAIPSETIWHVCPQLKPPAPILPRRNPIVEGINLLPYDYDQRIQNFLSEYLGNEAHPVPFGGRDDALHTLNDWLDTSTPYMLLAAPAGRGKSALLVRWLDSLSSREDLALVFVPVSIRFGTNMERVFYAALAARLAFLHGDDVPASPETSTAVYRGLVSDYLSKPLANGRTLLVVLDGLDEAADWQAGADFMPSELPASVRVVVSARFLAGDADSISWLRRLNWDKDQAIVPDLSPLTQGGVRNVLYKMGYPLDKLSSQVDIVAEMYRLSEGDPLLVGFYVSDLWAKGEEVTYLKLEDLVDIQPGYKGYFDRWWSDQKKLWGQDKLYEKHVSIMLNLLACALGPLSQRDMQALAPELGPNFTFDALNSLRRFVIGNDEKHGYIFSHPKLGQYFWESLNQSEQTAIDGRFFIWLEQTLQEFITGKRDPKKKTDVSIYIVQNYGAHLARGQEPIQKWLPLIHYQQWAQAWFTVEGAYGGYLQDVQRVREQCRMLDQQAIEATNKAPYLAEQIRCEMIESSLHSLAGNIPPQLIKMLVLQGIWSLQQAWVFVRQMPEGSQQSKAILELLPHLKDQQLLEIFTLMPSIRGEWAQAGVLSELSKYLAAEQLGQILITVKKFQSLELYSDVLNNIALLPEAELEQVLKAAREVALAAQQSRDRASVLGKLAKLLPELTDDALAAARQTEDRLSRARLLMKLIPLRPEVGVEAIRAAQEISGSLEPNRVPTFGDLARCLPERDVVRLLDIASKIKEESRPYLLDDLALHLPKEELKHLHIAARKMQAEGRAHVLAALSQRLPEVVDDAFAQTRKAIHENKPDALTNLAKYMPEKYLTRVLDLIGEIKNNEPVKYRILCELVKRMPQENLSQVLSRSLEITDEGNRAYLLSRCAQRLPEKYLGQVHAAAREIENEKARAKVLTELAQRLPEITGEAFVAAQIIGLDYDGILSSLGPYLPEDELEQVLVLARASKNERVIADLFGTLTLREPQLLTEALNIAKRLDNHYTRAGMLANLAQNLPENNLVQILHLVPGIAHEIFRDEVLIPLAQRLPDKELDQVLMQARKIKDARTRARVLTALAPRLPNVVGEALSAARAIDDKFERDRVRLLGSLANHLPQLVDEALTATRKIEDGSRIELLGDLAALLPEKALGKLLVEAQAIKDENDRANVLSKLAKYLPELTNEAITMTRALPEFWQRARILCQFAQYRIGVVVEALNTLPAIYLHDESIHEFSVMDLDKLIQPLIQVPGNQYYPSIQILLIKLTAKTRNIFFRYLSTLLPVLLHLGTEDTPREIYEAVRDVTTWWP